MRETWKRRNTTSQVPSKTKRRGKETWRPYPRKPVPAGNRLCHTRKPPKNPITTTMDRLYLFFFYTKIRKLKGSLRSDNRGDGLVKARSDRSAMRELS